MNSFQYKMISVVECDPASLGTVSETLQRVMAELRKTLPSVGAYFGSFLVGRHVGCLALIHLYKELNDVESAFGVYGSSPDFAEASQGGLIRLRERNLIRLSPSPLPGDDAVHEFEVLSRYSAPGLTDEVLGVIAPRLSAAGASGLRYGVLWTGSTPGHHVLSTRFRSLAEAVQAESGVMADPQLGQMIAGARLEERDILQVKG